MKSKGYDLLFNMLIEKNGKGSFLDNILNFHLKKKQNEIPIKIHKDREGFLAMTCFFPCNMHFKFIIKFKCTYCVMGIGEGSIAFISGLAQGYDQ